MQRFIVPQKYFLHIYMMGVATTTSLLLAIWFYAYMKMVPLVPESYQVTPQLLAILLEVPIHSLCQVSGHHAPGNTSIVSGALFLYLYWWKFRFWDACMRLNMCSTTALRLGCTSWDIWQVFCKFHHAFLFDFLHFLDLYHVWHMWIIFTNIRWLL